MTTTTLTSDTLKVDDTPLVLSFAFYLSVCFRSFLALFISLELISFFFFDIYLSLSVSFLPFSFFVSFSPSI